MTTDAPSDSDCDDDCSPNTTTKVAELMNRRPFVVVTTIVEAGALATRPMSHRAVELDDDPRLVAAADSRSVG